CDDALNMGKIGVTTLVLHTCGRSDQRRMVMSLEEILKQQGLSEEDLLLIIENKLVAQYAVKALNEVCGSVRSKLFGVNPTDALLHDQVKRLLLEGKPPSNHAERRLLRIAVACLKIHDRAPQEKITQRAVAEELGLTPQRMSQLMSGEK